ncbi:MAG: hypothetical protein HZY75_13165 [Nocardioidaceae bacterium]|nr:MAG: hypothetical protein HZY75_13165 [Nocardioidaceae bacterium]
MSVFFDIVILLAGWALMLTAVGVLFAVVAGLIALRRESAPLGGPLPTGRTVTTLHLYPEVKPEHDPIRVMQGARDEIDAEHFRQWAKEIEA